MPYNGGLLSNESLLRITGLYEDAAFVDRITTSPALLESSSMVLATGVGKGPSPHAAEGVALG